MTDEEEPQEQDKPAEPKQVRPRPDRRRDQTTFTRQGVEKRGIS